MARRDITNGEFEAIAKEEPVTDSVDPYLRKLADTAQDQILDEIFALLDWVNDADEKVTRAAVAAKVREVEQVVEQALGELAKGDEEYDEEDVVRFGEKLKKLVEDDVLDLDFKDANGARYEFSVKGVSTGLRGGVVTLASEDLAAAVRVTEDDVEMRERYTTALRILEEDAGVSEIDLDHAGRHASPVEYLKKERDRVRGAG